MFVVYCFDYFRYCFFLRSFCLHFNVIFYTLSELIFFCFWVLYTRLFSFKYCLFLLFCSVLLLIRSFILFYCYCTCSWLSFSISFFPQLFFFRVYVFYVAFTYQFNAFSYSFSYFFVYHFYTSISFAFVFISWLICLSLKFLRFFYFF